METIFVGKNAVVSNSGVEFITFNLHVKNQVEGAPLEYKIDVLQTIVPNVPTFKLLESEKLIIYWNLSIEIASM